MEKSIKSWLSELPSPYREQALENTDSIILNVKMPSLIKTINMAFIWDFSKEGYDYWEKLNDKIVNGIPLSPVPAPDEKLKEAVELLKKAKDVLPIHSIIGHDINSFLSKL